MALYPFICILTDFSDGLWMAFHDSRLYQCIYGYALFQMEMVPEDNYGTIFIRFGGLGNIDP